MDMAERSKINPYPGPRPFRVGEKLYGRDREITQLFYLLSAERIVVLHSPSGAGKSSLLNGGLVPRLQRERFDVWPSIRLSAPAADAGNRFVRSAILSLEEGLPPRRQRPVEQIAGQTLAQYIAERPRHPDAPSSVVLLFDQFEEIVTLDPIDVKAKQEFFRQLGETLKNPGLWALFALREDYLAPLDPYRDDVPTRLSNTFRIDLLSVEAGLEAITQPAHDNGREFADEAARKLVEDLSTVSVQQPDGSFLKVTGRYVEPVQLQVVCRRLWDELPADVQTIGVERLQDSGNVDAALAAYYDGCVADIAHGDVPYERRLRQWFSERLITSGGIRGQVLSGQDQGLDKASVGRLLDTHLVRSEQRVGKIWYELAHDRLVGPVSDSNLKWFDKNLHSFQKLAAVWKAQGQPDGLLIVGADFDFDEAMRWKEANDKFVTESEQTFLDKSSEKRREAQLKREAEQEKAEAQARYAQRMRWAAWVSGACALVAVVLGAWAYRASLEAKDAATVAVAARTEAQDNLSAAQIMQTRRLVEKAGADPVDPAKQVDPTNPVDPTMRILLALEALPDAAENINRPIVFGAQIVLSMGINDLGLLLGLKGHTRPVSGVAVTPDGARIVTGSGDKTARVWDASTGAELFQLKGHTGFVLGVAVTPDGTRIVTGSYDNTARVWDASTGAELFQLKGHTRPVSGVAVTPDGARIVTGSNDNTARVWDARTGAELLQLKGHTGFVSGVAVTPDGARIVTGSGDNTARVWDASTGAELFQLKGHTRPVLGVAVTPDGARIVTGSNDNTARVWDARTGAELFQLKGHTGFVSGVAVTPDGTRIVTGSNDATARVWDARTGAELFQLKGHTGFVLGVAVTPDGARIVTGSYDNTARVWGLAQLRPPQQHQFPDQQTFVQALVAHGKAVVPRCLTIKERQTFLLRPRPPGWCIDLGKDPYDANHWKAWKAGERGDAVADSTTAEAYSTFADAAIRVGDFKIALEAVELSMIFGPEIIWLRINRAHAWMFLNRIPEARAEYLDHRGKDLGGTNKGKRWEDGVVKDFQAYRKLGQERPLMKEIEQLFKASPPVK